MLVELGPGRGTLMADVLRALRAAPGFLDAAALWLVETSPALRARAGRARSAALRAALGGAGRGTCRRGPLFLVANEFFDALPVRQFRRADPGWQERRVGLDGGRLAFGFGPVRLDAGARRALPAAARRRRSSR